MAVYSFEGSTDFPVERASRVKIRCSEKFLVIRVTEDQEILIGPDSVNARLYTSDFRFPCTLVIKTDGMVTLEATPLAARAETPSGDKLVEVVEDSEISIYDRLRAEMLSMMSEKAEAKGYDSWEDDEDYEFEDDLDGSTPLTPYEYVELVEEVPTSKESIAAPQETDDPTSDSALVASSEASDSSNPMTD
jgi:hypothetical protein